MAEYYYDSDDEIFKRKDKKGNHLAINIMEAQQIVHLLELGCTVTEIKNKVQVSNPNCKSTTVQSFISNYEKGNIDMPENAPVPSKVFDSITESNWRESMENRIAKLESDILEFEKRMTVTNDSGLSNKVKSWIRR